MEEYLSWLQEDVTDALRKRLPVTQTEGWQFRLDSKGVWHVTGRAIGPDFQARFLALVRVEKDTFQVDRIHMSIGEKTEKEG